MKYNYEFSKSDYKTPFEIYSKVLVHWGIHHFTLDVCCSERNIPAHKHYIYGLEDGLEKRWLTRTTGLNHVWCNPPFNEAAKWVKKAHQEFTNVMAHHGGKLEIAMLLPVRTETKYWQEYILNNPCANIQFLEKGYKFLDKNNNQMGVFKNAFAIVYFEDIYSEKHCILQAKIIKNIK